MVFLLTGLSVILSIGSLICFIMIVVKMFQNSDQTLGIISLVGLLLCGLGALVAFVMGWVNSGKYNAQQIMLIWTGCIVGNIVLNIIAAVTGAATIQVNP